MNIPARCPPHPPGLSVGWVGFTYYPESVISRGIAWFSRWGGLGKWPLVSHAFIVGPEGTLVEAHIQNGVQVGQIKTYADDPKCSLYFRQPAGLTEYMGTRIYEAAFRRVGHKYDKGLIVSAMLANTFVGHFMNKLTGGSLNRFVSKQMNKQQRVICSELVAEALSEIFELRGQGILSEPAFTIKPRDLFTDQVIFV